MKTKPTTIIISNITIDTFNQLNDKHGENLLCLCSTISIPYQNFTSINLTIHPVCLSNFIDQKWIKALYFENASQYGVWDFRTTAFSQFELLSSFCSLSEEIISQMLIDIDKNELVTFYLRSEKQIQMEINGKIESLKNSISSRIISFLTYLRNTNQAHRFISALNTNLIIHIRDDSEDDEDLKLESYDVGPDSVNDKKVCSEDIFVIDATFCPLNHESITSMDRTRMKCKSNPIIINGFLTGCTPLEAILRSTLDCLYETKCLQLLFDYFPNLKKINFNPNNSILTSEHENFSVNEYLNNLFIRNWLPDIKYEKYFHKCSPSLCTYSITNRSDLSYGITLFISLYGGLIIILRLISSFIIDVCMKWKCSSKKRNEHSPRTLVEQQRTIISKSIYRVKRLNLFKNVNERSEKSIKQQKIITFVYFIFLFGSICILCLFTSLNSETLAITVPNVSMTDYDSLEMLYSHTLRCPCSNKAISYERFVSLSPRFHQLCSSGFIDTYWMYLLKIGYSPRFYNDWRNGAYQQFQLLFDFCKLANETIDDAMKRYLKRLFIVSSVMNKDDFNKQINSSLNQFYKSTAYNFGLMINVSQLLMQIDQLYTRAYGSGGHEVGTNLILNGKADEIDKNKPLKLQFLLNGIQEMHSNKISCICAIDPHCQMSSVIYAFGLATTSNNGKTPAHNVSGWVHRCMHIDSLLLSTFECFYEDSECFPLLLRHLDERIEEFDSPILRPIDPLINNPTMTRFPPNTTISIMFKEIMIEQWIASSSYKLFYEACAPTHCTYSKRIRKEDFIGVIITLISMIGGIVVSLRIITPHLVKFIYGLLAIIFKKKERQQQQRRKRIELNIFSSRDFESNIHRLTVIHYGRWATRLYILFKFITEEWRIALINSFVSDLSVYSPNDYRRFLSAHIQYLQGLCLFSQELVNNGINEFLSSLLITIELLSKQDFQNRFNTFIQQSKINTPILFSHLLFITRIVNHGNAFMSTYGTNFIYSTLVKRNSRSYAYTEAIIYDNECSCGLSSNCTTQAIFIDRNSSEIIPIEGLKMGCTPSESFHLSTLECFYNQSCLNLIYQYTNISIPLSNTSNYFPPNTTINELINHSFVEQWSNKTNYSLYYSQCAPLLFFKVL
ncbi:hypothetical protein I4U23_005616 [Adineta vaga]|nr:hypothetical protein I4U23_005616 [Adineta vaga]